MMSLFSTSVFDKMVEALLLNSYTIMPVGFFDGKAGISLALFELARFTNGENIEEHAFNLLQEALAYDTEYNNFNYGRAGIAFVLDYLINHNFLDADYAELYKLEQSKVLEEIREIDYRKEDGFKNIDYFLFINAISRRIEKEEFIVCETRLSECIYLFFNEEFELKEVDYFYSTAAKFLSVCNSFAVSDTTVSPIVQRIWEKEKKLNQQDYLCENALYSIKKHIYRELNIEKLQKRDFEQCNPMTDIVVQCLNLKEKISLVYDINRLYALNHNYDYRIKADLIVNSFVDEDLTLQEEKLLRNLPLKAEQICGVGTGISRILLLYIYWESIKEGVFPDRITKLFT